MITQIKETVKSREFQTGAGQVAIMVTSIIVSSMVSQMVSKGLNTGLEALMDKIHGEKVETPAK